MDKRKALKHRWHIVLAILLDEGQATAAQITEAQNALRPCTIALALSELRRRGFAQRIGNKLWGLTKAGIEAALQAEQEAQHG